MVPRRLACFLISWHGIPVGTTFGHRNRFRDTGGGVASSVESSRRLQHMQCERERYNPWTELQIALVVVGAVGGKSRRPRQRSGAGRLDVVQAHMLTESSRHSLSWFRGQSFQTLCGRDSDPHCGGKRHQHRWEQPWRTCHAHLFTKGHASRRWRHEQQLSSVGFPRHTLPPET